MMPVLVLQNKEVDFITCGCCENGPEFNILNLLIPVETDISEKKNTN